ncbi:MAG: AAA family ATPase [Anaerolinea sp.]|nr:AAA family ATPase [Anaerolinea sp.]
MYLSKVKIENFRKFKLEEILFQPGLNLLVGENDSGKSAVIDAIRHVLGTRDNEWQRITTDDFHLDSASRAKKLRIECRFDGLNEEEAGAFLEWLGVEEAQDSKVYFLRLWLEAERKDESEIKSRFDRMITVDIKAGPDSEGRRIEAEAREMLRATYLQPLRDAEQGLAARKGSRLSHILYAHDDIKKQEDKDDPKTILSIMLQANKDIKEHPMTLPKKASTCMRLRHGHN